jgi:hypothetical protein
MHPMRENKSTVPLQEMSRELRLRLLGAHFTEALEFVRPIPPILPKSTETLSLDDTLALLKLRAMCAEVLDYWGLFSEAAEVVGPSTAACKRILVGLLSQEKPPSVGDEERQLLRQRIWVLLHAGMVEYRQGAFDKALELFTICDRVAREHLATRADQAWGTRARAQYSIGLVFRERLDFDRALEHFTFSIENAWNSIKRPAGIQPCELSKLTYVAIAKNLGLGLAFIHAYTGRPDLALPLLLAAKSILQPLNEELISAYVDLIYANVLRGTRGNSREVMEEVLQILQGCYKYFKDRQHFLYQARAGYYLALTYLQRARPDESVFLSDAGEQDLRLAEEYTKDLTIQSEKSGDMRFGQYQFVLMSRIQRKRDLLPQAIEKADWALQLAAPTGGVHADALLARAEARARLGNLRGAAEDFEAVLKDSSNPRTRAYCLLQLSRVQSRGGNQGASAGFMSEFERIKPQVTHVQIEALEIQTRAELANAGKDLVIRYAEKDLTASKVERLKRKFLIDWARSKSTSDKEASKLLGVSRQTFYNWCQALHE